MKFKLIYKMCNVGENSLIFVTTTTTTHGVRIQLEIILVCLVMSCSI